MDKRTLPALLLGCLLCLLGSFVALPARAQEETPTSQLTASAEPTVVEAATPPPLPAPPDGDDAVKPTGAADLPADITPTATLDDESDEGYDDDPYEDEGDAGEGYEDDPYVEEEWTTEPTPTPLVNERPDGAEPNDTRDDAKPLPLDAVSGPFTLLPEGDQDWYSVDLGAQSTGLPLEISVRGTGGLDLVTTVYRADAWTPLAIIGGDAISTTLPADMTGSLVLKVDNRAPELASGESYRIEVRRTLPPLPTPLPVTQERPELLPDGLENNWSFATAAPVGVGASYDLNFVCPDVKPNACAGGDHDYLRFTVKAGLRYLITTYDLAPGVDTVLDLYWGSEEIALTANDDARPQGSFLSTLRWVAPADGEAVLRVAPRTGGLQPVGFDDDTGSYRLAIVLADTPLAEELEARIAEQTNAPTPTPTTEAIATATTTADDEPYQPYEPAPSIELPAATAQPEPSEARDGSAVVVVPETALRTQPNAESEVLEILKQEQLVTLLGQVSGTWVKVETDTGVAPGWVYAPHLQRRAVTPTADATPVLPSDGAPPMPTEDTTTGDDLIEVVALDPLEQAVAPTPSARTALTITVQVRAALPPDERPRTATPADTGALSGVRVQIVDAFGNLLTEALTAANGHVTLSVAVAADQALWVQLPAAGLRVALDENAPTVTLDIPQAALAIGATP
jgi:hypothetical protein